MKLQSHRHMINNEVYIFSSPIVEDANLLALYFKDLFHESARYLNFSEHYYDNEDVDKQRAFVNLINNEISSCAIIIKHNARIIGHLVLKNFGYERASHRANLAMGVLKKFQGLGLGSQLIELAQEACDQLGIYAIELRVRDFNLAAQHLYEKHGFEKIGEIRGAAFLDDEFFSEHLYAWNSPSFQLLLDKKISHFSR